MHNLFEICYNNSKLALSKYIRTSQIYTCYKTRYWCIPNNCTACRVRRTLHMVLSSLENKDATVHTYFDNSKCKVSHDLRSSLFLLPHLLSVRPVALQL